MTSRIVAITLGLLAGAAALAFLVLDWDGAMALVRPNPPAFARALVPTPARVAWIATGAVSAFTIVALLAALIAGLVETLTIRSRIGALRHDPALAGRWNAADWRAVFARTTIADRAETMIAAAPPMNPGEERRVTVDVPLLLGLSRDWLERLTLSWSTGPLPAILLGLGATMAVAATAAGDDWSGALAAGFAGWLIVTIARYAASVALMPFVTAAVAAATAAIRPLTAAPQAPDLGPVRAAAPAPVIDAQIVAAALADALREPLSRLDEAADRLTKVAPPGSDSIDDAMSEVRAGIERLLATTKR